MKFLKRCALALFVTVAASSASADSVFVDFLTSDSIQDIHVRGDYHAGDRNLIGRVLGDGLGAGHVDDASPADYSHIFLPDVPVASVSSAWLTVWLSDDLHGLGCRGVANCTLTGDRAEIQISDGSTDSSFYDGPASTFAFGNVTGSIQNAGDTLFVTISAEAGNFEIRGSALTVFYQDGLSLLGTTPTSTVSTPEPSAALLFGLGGLVIAKRARQRP